MTRILSVVVLAAVLCTSVALAEVRMPALFSDHMVLQRDIKVPVWGWAEPGEKVTVMFAGQRKNAKADKNGKWMVRLAPLKASAEGRALVVRDQEAGVTFTNVVVGEVWLCTGQSNMDYEFAGGRRGERNLLAEFDAEANYPAIRHFAVPETSAVGEQDDMANASGWQVCSPATVKAFSAVGYFYGRLIHKETGVPVGLITSAVGGTKIEAWARAQELSKVPGCEYQVAAVVERAKEVADGTFTMKKAMDNWTAKNDPGLGWKSPTYDASGWDTMPVPARWGSAKDKGLATFKGLVWFRRTVNLPADFAGKDLIVSVGMIDDRDTTFFNGKRIGSGMQFNEPRRYTVPGKWVKAGPNVIAVRVWNGWGDGGIWGEPKDVSVYPKGQPEEGISLAGDWRYKTSLPAGVKAPAPVRMGTKSRENLATGLYNGMIAPIVPYAIRGAIWYQGESNGGEGSSYMHKTRALVEGWRNAWAQGKFPFYYVQLANFQAPGENPEGGDGWAKTRMAQLQALDIKRLWTAGYQAHAPIRVVQETSESKRSYESQTTPSKEPGPTSQ